MAKEKEIDISKDVFRNIALRSKKDVHITSDGLPFIDPGHAEKHAAGLKNKEVLVLKYNSVKKADAPEPLKKGDKEKANQNK